MLHEGQENFTGWGALWADYDFVKRRENHRAQVILPVENAMPTHLHRE
jgi:hypothetical protein